MYYKKLDWPVLNDQQHAELLSTINTQKNPKPIGAWGSTYLHYTVPSSILTWCKENLPIDGYSQIVLQRFCNVNSIPVHTDIRRTENIIYLLSESGPITRWQKEGVVVDEICVPQHQWFSLNTGAPHEVLNLNGDRVAISIFNILYPVSKKSA